MTLDLSKGGSLLHKTTLLDNLLYCATMIFVGYAVRLNTEGKTFIDSSDSKITQSGFVFARYFLYFDAFLRPLLCWHHRERMVKILSNVLLVDQKVSIVIMNFETKISKLYCSFPL